MNEVLAEILRTGEVKTATGETLPLHSNMDVEEGELINHAFSLANPKISMEIGCAYGISALFACDALSPQARHIIIDPFQSTQWKGIGLANLGRAGHADKVELEEVGSEFALPKHVAAGTRIQAAIIDGNHTFDHALVDFFYVNRMLDVGGVVILDDTNWPALAQLYDFISKYPCYKVIGTVGEPRKESGVKAARTAVRRGLAKAVNHRIFASNVDYPRCVAFQKTSEDTRNWDWHARF